MGNLRRGRTGGGGYLRASWAALALIAPVTGAAAQDGRDSVQTRLHFEARQALQGFDTLPFLDPTRIEQVVFALPLVRAAAPALGGWGEIADGSSLAVALTDEARLQADTVAPLEASVSQLVWRRTIGVASVDSLNAVLGADSSQVYYIGAEPWEIRPRFARAPNVPVLAARYWALPAVSAAYALSAPVYNWIHLTPVGPFWYFTFVRGDGDCPSGCTAYEYVHVRYSPTTHEALQVTDVPAGVSRSPSGPPG